MTPTPTSGAADLPEALRLAAAISNLLCSNEAAARTLAAAADELVRLHAESEMRRAALLDEMQKAALAAGQATAAQQGAAYAALPDEGEPWRGHKFKEVQRGCWRCDCGKTIKEVTSDQSTPASGGNYPVMPKRYTVDDDGEELFTAEKMRAFADATHTLRASHGEAPAQTADSQLLQFYGVTTDAELIAAQAAHIEKLQAKLTKTPSFAPQRVREG